MGLLNSNQILPGARRPGAYVGYETYATAGLVTVPTTTVTGDTVSLGTTGSIEIEGTVYPMNGATANTPNTFDFGNIATLLSNGRDYLLSAVPRYIEPIDRATAEALTPRVNYTVKQNELNEGILSYFIPSDVDAMVASAGGIELLRKRRSEGTATSSEITILNHYDEEFSRLSDPRFSGRLLSPVGYDFMLAEVFTQDNTGVPNLFNKAGFTRADFESLRATQSEIPAQRRVILESEAATLFNASMWKVRSAVRYTANRTNALADISPTAIDITVANPFAAAGTAYVGVMEYYFPTWMPEGHIGKQLGISKFLAKEDSLLLGRVNPIYLENPIAIAKTAMGANARSALTLYADPVSIVRLTAAVSGNTVTLTKVADMFDMIIGG